jgi:predicted RND superfamily exporter protein
MIERVFHFAARVAVRSPWTVLAVALVSAVAALVVGATRVELRTSNLDLVDPDLPEMRRFLAFAEEFGTPNLLVVVLEGDSEDALGEAVDRVGPALRAVPGVASVVDRLDAPAETLEELDLDDLVLSFDRRLCFVFVQPVDTRSRAETLGPFVAGVRAALARARLDDLGVRTGLTGLPVYAIDDRDVIQRDVTRLSLLGLLLVGAVFVVGFGAFVRPLAALAAMAVGSALAVGAIAIFPGHLTLVSSFFASILFGLGIDYGIHAIRRVEELVAEGRAEADAIVLAMRSVGPGIATGAATTAAAFYAMRWSGFRGFEELGVISGNGVLLCLIATMWVLPAALAVAAAARGRLTRGRAHPERARPAAGRWLLNLQHPALAAALVVAVVASVLARPPAFDGDYLHLQPRDSETARWEREMVSRSDLSPQFAVVIADSKDRVRELSDAFLDAEGVGEVRSIADLEEAEGAGASIAVPAAYRALLESPRGRYAVYAYPEGDVWDPAVSGEFRRTARSIDPEATGMPFLGAFMIEQSRRALRVSGLLGAILVLGCVLADFRRPLPAAIAAVPAFLSVAAMNGLMALWGGAWNPLNVMALPMVLGIAVDDGVHMMHRFREEGGDLRRTLAGTGRAVLLTSLTDVAAFGSLALTTHRGLASFALALVAGVAAGLVLSLLVLPSLLAAARSRLVAPSRSD